MANCCCTDIAIYTDDDDQAGIMQISRLLRVLEERHENSTDYGHVIRLTELLKAHGENSIPERDRGHVISWLAEKASLIISQEDAWYPRVDCWKQILRNHYPNLRMVYRGEEPGCGVFVNTDETGAFFSDSYRLAYFPEDESDPEYGEPGEFYFENESELLEELFSRTGFRAADFQEAQKWARDHEMSIDEFVTYD